MRKITKCTGEGHGSCTRCTENGKWNRIWMCLLNKIEGLDGIYCNDCTKELVKHFEQFEPKPITEENSSVRKSCLSISWILPVKGYMLVEAESYEEAVDKANHDDRIRCILDVQEDK